MPASTAQRARLAIRRGEHTGHTVGLAPGHVQANLVMLPQAQAGDFLLYCQRNPKPCPLLAVSDPGAWVMPAIARDLDLRHDLPRYRVWRHGELVEAPCDIEGWWRDDLVAFAIGCSFSFEEALVDAGIPLRHLAQGRNVAMYRTGIDTVPAGAFRGPLVVSMRPMNAADAIRAVQITSRYPGVHGAPVHLGRPDLIGIDDLARPDDGDPIEVLDDEMPVFWACGVTPQAAAVASRLPFCVTHAPGCMLVTDLRNPRLATG